uniref:Uncharacterized protein n=1 Tax=Physcomitrium patens TaxID=3218 RepID=A0A2K1JV69_PHYPA|nr:hypothetical protein PHYPA_015199 [Physcomitrium patens]
MVALQKPNTKKITKLCMLRKTCVATAAPQVQGGLIDTSCHRPFRIYRCHIRLSNSSPLSLADISIFYHPRQHSRFTDPRLYLQLQTQ